MPPAVRTSAAMVTLTPTLASAWTSAIGDEFLRRGVERVGASGDDRLLSGAVRLQVLIPARVEAGGDVQPVAGAVDRPRVSVQRDRRQDEHPVRVCHQVFFLLLRRASERATATACFCGTFLPRMPSRMIWRMFELTVARLEPRLSGISCRPVASRR